MNPGSNRCHAAWVCREPQGTHPTTLRARGIHWSRAREAGQGEGSPPNSPKGKITEGATTTPC